MSSDEGSLNNDVVEVVSDNEQNNEILEIGEDLQDQEEQTEEVQRDETVEAEGDENDNGQKKPVKPKRIVRNPQPKLNDQALKGPRGIAALESYFQRVKFKGKGKEQQDLDVIMKTYEYWCHRLFPKFPFDSCIDRLEKLGSKRAVQTHIKRIRFDLLVEDKPIVDDSDEEPNVDGFVDIQNDEINQQQNQQFDELLGSPALAPAQTPVELTEEQLERIRLNKERAEKLKQARLKQIKEKAVRNLQVSSQLPGTSGFQSESRLDSFEVAESTTQSDIFSQPSALESRKDTQDVLGEIDDTGTLFDHESSVKGKTNLKGINVKKKSNKRSLVFYDSENSDDESSTHNGNEALLNKEIADDTELVDMNQNSNSGLVQKKRTNTIYDSDDDDSEINNKSNDIHEKVSRSESLSPDDNLADKNFIEKNTLDNFNEQKLEQVNKSLKKINRTRKTRKNLNDIDKDDSEQVMDTDEVQLCTINEVNGLSINDLDKQLSDLTSLEQQPKSSPQISSSSKNNETNNLIVNKMPETNKNLSSSEPMEIIEGELEAVLKSSQNNNFTSSLKTIENKENSSENNTI